MVRKKLLVLVASGASVELGIPSTSRLTKELAIESARLAKEHGSSDLFAQCLTVCRASAGRRDIVSRENFEEALALMPRIMSWIAPENMDPLRLLCKSSQLRIELPDSEYFDWAGRDFVKDFYVRLVLHLAKTMRGHCNLIHDSDKLQVHSNFFKALAEEYELCVIDLNYDNLVDRALPGLFNGFQGSNFNPSSVLDRNDWQEHYHLHGSVHFEVDTTADGRDKLIKWQTDLHKQFNAALYHEFSDPRFESFSIPTTSIVTGAAKTDQVLYEPFLSYFLALNRRVQAADCVLFCGYGFADLHVNRVVRNRMQRSDPPACVVLDYVQPDSFEWHDRPAPFVGQRGDLWNFNLKKTLCVEEINFIKSMFKNSNKMFTFDEFRSRKLFDVSDNRRVSVWHHGFLAACAEIEAVIAHLDCRGRPKPQVVYAPFRVANKTV